MNPSADEMGRLAAKCRLMRLELSQYYEDLKMWKTAHGADYPARRLMELTGPFSGD